MFIFPKANLGLDIPVFFKSTLSDQEYQSFCTSIMVSFLRGPALKMITQLREESTGGVAVWSQQSSYCWLVKIGFTVAVSVIMDMPVVTGTPAKFLMHFKLWKVDFLVRTNRHACSPVQQPQPLMASSSVL